MLLDRGMTLLVVFRIASHKRYRYDRFLHVLCINPMTSARPPHECGGHLWTSTVASVRPLATRRGIAGHTGNSPADCHSSTRRQLEARGAGSTTAVRVGRRPAVPLPVR